MLKIYRTGGMLRKPLFNLSLKQQQPLEASTSKPFPAALLHQHQQKQYIQYHHQQDLSKSSAVIDLPRITNAKHTKYSYSVSDNHGLRLLSDTIGDRIDSLAESAGDQVAYKYCLTQQSITFGDLKQRTDAIAQNLLHMGFKKGDRLALLLPNIPELNLTMMACASIGVITVLMNPAYQPVEVEYMLKKTGAKGLVMLDNLRMLQHYKMLKSIVPELESADKGALNSARLPDLKHVILASNRLMRDPEQATAGTYNWDELVKCEKPRMEKPHVDMDDDFVIMFTSGTTGSPKGTLKSTLGF